MVPAVTIQPHVTINDLITMQNQAPNNNKHMYVERGAPDELMLMVYGETMKGF